MELTQAAEDMHFDARLGADNWVSARTDQLRIRTDYAAAKVYLRARLAPDRRDARARADQQLDRIYGNLRQRVDAEYRRARAIILHSEDRALAAIRARFEVTR